MLTVGEFLRRRQASAFRRLEESLRDVAAADAVLGADPNWRRYEHGDGLDGSVQGIVRHVALWKHVAAAGLVSGNFPPAATLEAPAEWLALLTWLRDGQEQLRRAAAGLGDEALEEEVEWLGYRMDRATLLAHMIEHDQYHTGQVNLLRQQAGASGQV